MNINLMRQIDFFIGVPLTFILSGCHKLWHLFLPLKKHTPPRRVLFIELSEMGSTILADPAMNKVKHKLNAEVYFLIFAKNKASLDLLKTVPDTNIFTLRENNLFVFIYDTFRFFVWSRLKHIDE